MGHPDTIEPSALPDRFVFKCTHNSGGVILCADKTKFDFSAAKKQLKKQLKKNYYDQSREWLYKDVPRRVLAEAYLGSDDGTPPDDYKFFALTGGCGRSAFARTAGQPRGITIFSTKRSILLP
jgi:hypothetical protein